jgi:hypothetical protein
MKLALLFALALAACQSSGDDYPVLNGGGGTGRGGTGGNGGGGGSDAGAGDGGLTLRGRVCRLADLRNLGNTGACDSLGVGGLTVTLGIGPSTTPGTRSATTVDDGSFLIAAPTGAGFTWHVFGGAGTGLITRSAMPFGTDNTIPVISDDRYNLLLGGSGATVTDLQGSIFLHVVQSAKGQGPDRRRRHRLGPGRPGPDWRGHRHAGAAGGDRGAAGRRGRGPDEHVRHRRAPVATRCAQPGR